MGLHPCNSASLREAMVLYKSPPASIKATVGYTCDPRQCIVRRPVLGHNAT